MTTPKNNIAEAYSKYRKLVFSIAYRILKTTMSAEDVVQDVFLKLGKIKKEIPEDRLGSWLYIVTKNTALKHLKKEKREINMADPCEWCSNKMKKIDMQWIRTQEDLEPAIQVDFWATDPDTYVNFENPSQLLEKAEKCTNRENALRQSLPKLNKRQRLILDLRYVEELSYGEIAEKTSLSVGNVGFILHTTIKKLNNLISKV